MPPWSLEADHFLVHGVGISGKGNGTSFDLEIADGATSTIELLPGDYTLTTTVWNDDTPSVAVGCATTPATIVVGTPTTIFIICLPYTGAASMSAQISWGPDILALPVVEVSLLGGDAVV